MLAQVPGKGNISGSHMRLSQRTTHNNDAGALDLAPLIHDCMSMPAGRWPWWPEGHHIGLPHVIRTVHCHNMGCNAHPLHAAEAEAEAEADAHELACRTLALVPGKGIVSGSHDTSLRLWNAAGTCLRVLEGHTALVYAAAATPEGLVASASEDNTARLWQGDGTCLQVIPHPGTCWPGSWGVGGGHWKLPVPAAAGVHQETWLFGGLGHDGSCVCGCLDAPACQYMPRDLIGVPPTASMYCQGPALRPRRTAKFWNLWLAAARSRMFNDQR